MNIFSTSSLGQSLDYYAKDDESKLLGSIELSSAKILETPYNRDEPDKWLFDIAPGSYLIL